LRCEIQGRISTRDLAAAGKKSKVVFTDTTHHYHHTTTTTPTRESVKLNASTA
jgi:hypothetical protein